jgi:hypothetical protein
MINSLKAPISVVVLFAILVGCWSVMPAQDDPGHKGGTPGRWEGIAIRSSSDKSTLTVRKVGSSNERTIQYDSSTRWVAQQHGSKKVEDIDVTKVKDGDRVICEGTWDKNGVLHATLISKRLSHMQ